MFSFAFWVIRALKCEVVNFLKFKLAGVPVRPFEYLITLILIIAHAPCMHAYDRHAQHDVMWFTSCKPHHHDVTSICIPFMPHRNEVA